MTRLALTLTPSKCETATSWLSRLAARNGATYVQDFVEDLGLSWRRVIGGDREVISGLCDLAGTDPSIVLRHAKRTEAGRETFLGSVPVGTKFCQNSRMNVCPHCIMEWRQADGQLTAGAPVWWQAVCVRSCERHGISLIELPRSSDIRCNYDFAGRVRDNITAVRTAAEAARPAQVSDFELYMISRLSPTQSLSGGWLDEMEVMIVANVCQALGLTLINKARPSTKSLSPDDLAQAAVAGFQALRHGPEQMHRHLRSAQDGPAGGGMGFMHDFKPFYRYLSSNCVSGSGFPIRRSGLCHGVENCQQLAGAGHDDQLSWFTGGDEPLFEGPEDWIEPAGGEGCKIEAPA